MKFTKEEISLCKQVAEKHKKEIGLGDWFLSPETGDVEFLCQYGYGERNVFIPLWTISDCLEFFGARKYYFNKLVEDDMCLFEVHVLAPDRTGGIITKGGTALGTFLKAVLAVLEEEK